MWREGRACVAVAAVANLGAAVGVEHRAERLQGFGMCPGEDIHAAAIGDHQSGLAQLGQVVADGAVGEVQDRSPLGPHAGAELPGWMPLGSWLSGGTVARMVRLGRWA